VYKKADRTWHSTFFVLFFRRAPHRKVGVVAGKKVGKAVQRNRAKRLLRALMLERIDRLASGEYVLVAKPPILDQPYAVLLDEFDRALQRTGALSKGRV
jgi:ribonuclease P protein component